MVKKWTLSLTQSEKLAQGVRIAPDDLKSPISLQTTDDGLNSFLEKTKLNYMNSTKNSPLTRSNLDFFQIILINRRTSSQS